MPIITISGEREEFIKDWAFINYENFYERMSKNPEIRERSVYTGKLGEEAVGQYLEIEANYNNIVDEGYDLVYQERRIAVKTKGIKVFPKTLDEWWCHIPIDQYSKVFGNSEILVACIALIQKPKVWIVGYLEVGEADSLKEYHEEGQWLSATFQLPHPDSYGILATHFHPIEDLKGENLSWLEG